MSAFTRIRNLLCSPTFSIALAMAWVVTSCASIAVVISLAQGWNAPGLYWTLFSLGLLLFSFSTVRFIVWRSVGHTLLQSLLEFGAMLFPLVLSGYAIWFWYQPEPKKLLVATSGSHTVINLGVFFLAWFLYKSYAPWRARQHRSEDDGVAYREAKYRLLKAPPGPDTVRILYGTNRTRSPLKTRMYSGNRGTLRYGECVVSIPPDHKTGQLEGPCWRKLEFKEDPRKHIMVAEETELDAAEWQALAKELSASSTVRQALLFVHGFNVTFKDAARQTAQIAHDLKFKGVPAFYSWPSRGGVKPYPADEATIEAAGPFFAEFLVSFLGALVADQVYLIAHSMGNRLVTKIVAKLALERPELARKIRHVILAAPDIDADAFKFELGPQLVEAGMQATMYASSKDRALQASKRFHQYQRAGDTEPSVIVVEGIDTIDASEIETGFIGLRHSYYARKDSILSDMRYVLQGIPPLDRHRLDSRDSSSGSYYYFVP